MNDRMSTLGALQRLEKRTAIVLYQQQKWFKWVRQEQQDEEEARENESKRIKREAELFKRHWKALQGRLKARKKEEDIKREEAFLDKAFRERQAACADEAEDNDAEWDPIEDEVEEDKEKYVHLLKHLLWLDHTPAGSNEPAPSNETAHSSEPTTAAPTKTLNRNQKKRAKKQAKELAVPSRTNKSGEGADDGRVNRVSMNETEDELRKRLLEGEQLNQMEGMSGVHLDGTVASLHETVDKVLGLPPAEIDKLIEDIREIKQLLFCRLLISYAVLFPAALRASSLEEFLTDPEVTPAELRDFALRYEQPSLQEVRDACADFARGDEEADDDPSPVSDDDEEQESVNKINDKIARRKAVLGWNTPLNRWQAKHEKALKPGEKPALFYREGNTVVDFGVIDDESGFQNKKIRIKVCGKSIWNYPSQNAMARGGWFHFSILAKGTKLGEAVQVCRNWNEFWQLDILAINNYFPSASWRQWKGDTVRTQLLQLGLIPKFFFKLAEEMTIRKQGGGHGHGGRVHNVKEFRNFMVGHIKRSDPVSRRFVQYLTLEAADLCIVVRDAKSGRILVSPPEEERWLIREKSGLGRASRNAWNVISKVDESLFEQVDDMMYDQFRFNFTDHYEIIVWDVEAGRSSGVLANLLHVSLTKAHRFTSSRECQEPSRSILEQLYQEKDTERCRDVMPGEKSMWDDLQALPETSFQHRMFMNDTKTGKPVVKEATLYDTLAHFYNDIDAAEDEILFPEEKEGILATAITGHSDMILRELDESGPKMIRFIHNLDTDEDSDEYTEEFLEMEKKTNSRNKIEEQKKAKKSLAIEGEVDNKKGSNIEERKKHKLSNGSRAVALRNKNAQFNQQEANRNGTGRYPGGHDLVAELEAGRNRPHNWQNKDAVCPNDFAEGCICRVCKRVDLKQALQDISESKGDIDQLPSDDGDEEWDSEDSVDEDFDEFDDDDDAGEFVDEDELADDDVDILDLQTVAKDEREFKRLVNFFSTKADDSLDMPREFAIFVDREKAKVFKPQWHAADFEPGAQKRYAEFQKLKETSARMNKSSYIRGRWIQVLFWLNIHMDEHRLVMKDISDTFAIVALFFPYRERDSDGIVEQIHHAFRQQLHGDTIPNDSSYAVVNLVPDEIKCIAEKMLSNEFKSTSQPPYYRTWHSNRQVPQSIFPPPGVQSDETWREWDKVVRPAVAHLYKAGVIAPWYSRDTAGQAFAAPDPSTKAPSMFIDYRRCRHLDTTTSTYGPIDLLSLAKSYAAKHKSARYALLRVYTHPLFWPLQMGNEVRYPHTFTDAHGRSWQWKFYPKDVDSVHRGMHRVVAGRLERFREAGQLPRNKVIVNRDIILVMGDDQEDLEQLMLGTVFGIQGIPWRLEIDFWRSFVDVGVEFLEGLDKEWLDFEEEWKD